MNIFYWYVIQQQFQLWNISILTVSKEYGRVLFSSEGDALKLLSQNNGNSERDGAEGLEYIGQPPPTDLVVEIAELLRRLRYIPKTGA